MNHDYPVLTSVSSALGAEQGEQTVGVVAGSGGILFFPVLLMIVFRQKYPGFLSIAALVAVIFAWFAILFTGRYPRGLFGFVEGVGRWHKRVAAYAFALVTARAFATCPPIAPPREASSS